MVESSVLISIVSFFVGFASLLVGALSLRYAIKSLKGQKYLADLSENQEKQIGIVKKQINRMNKITPEKIILEREKIELKKREQETKEKRQQLNAFYKTIKFFKDLGD